MGNYFNKTTANNTSSTQFAERKEEHPIKIVSCFNYLKNLINKPKYSQLEFSPLAWLKINAYINIVGDIEVTGFGKIEEIDGEHFITDVKILPQTATGATVDCTEESMLEFISEIPPEEMGLWNLDWHSHVDMDTFVSGQDSNNYEIMQKMRMGKSFPFIIINKSQKVLCANWLGNGRYSKMTCIIPDELNVMSEKELKTLYKQCEEDVVSNCRVIKKYRTYNNVSNLSTKNLTTSKINDIIDNIEETIEEEPTCTICGEELFTVDEYRNQKCQWCSDYQ